MYNKKWSRHWCGLTSSNVKHKAAWKNRLKAALRCNRCSTSGVIQSASNLFQLKLVRLINSRMSASLGAICGRQTWGLILIMQVQQQMQSGRSWANWPHSFSCVGLINALSSHRHITGLIAVKELSRSQWLMATTTQQLKTQLLQDIRLLSGLFRAATNLKPKADVVGILTVK